MVSLLLSFNFATMRDLLASYLYDDIENEYNSTITIKDISLTATSTADLPDYFPGEKLVPNQNIIFVSIKLSDVFSVETMKTLSLMVIFNIAYIYENHVDNLFYFSQMYPMTVIEVEEASDNFRIIAYMHSVLLQKDAFDALYKELNGGCFYIISSKPLDEYTK